MKKFVLFVLSAMLLLVTLTGCSNTETFQSASLSKYVKLGDYKNITVDTSSKDYKDRYKQLYSADAAAAGCFDVVSEGTVKDGDIVNIDFSGTRNGEKFDGGTSTDYNLTIGSDSFIDGFEDGLIGVNVGDTTDLNLKFPENYDNAQLAGQAVVFTVKVNYINVPQSPEKTYQKLGYKSLDEYKENLDARTKEALVEEYFIGSCKIKSAPETENFRAVVLLGSLREGAEANGQDVKTYLASFNKTPNGLAEGFASRISSKQFERLDEFKPTKDSVLAYYALCEKEGLKIDKSKLDDYTSYEKCYEESLLIEEAAKKWLLKNTTFK